ncbi:hypothetical protein CALCODRAFT_501124 [Calocera cornea HHB12733]|uniref:Autophagy-related protein 4 n=1 Tax=Calocera cornea HHB12733 TaxID=1353952 RepID=A0A165DSE4_9BASI|nr:hypothetical protein CALCODRAFT_501124 [Calocera cornea HHB12733]
MSASSPPVPPSSSSSSNTKLARFTRNQQGRDRSRSTSAYLEATSPPPAPPPGTSTNNGGPVSSSTSNRGGPPRRLGRGLTKKRSKLFGRGSDSESKASTSSDRDTTGPSPPPTGSSPSSSPPMILTTPTSPPQSAYSLGQRGRNSFQSSRAPSSFDPGFPSGASGGVLPSNASIISTSTALHRLSDIPGRLTGWLGTHFTPPSPNPGGQSLSSSASSYPAGSPGNNYAAPSLPASQPSSAPSSAAGNHRHSGFLKGSGAKAPGAIERTLRYIFDSDANPDKSEVAIWLLGTQHPGWSSTDVQPTDRSPSQSPVQSHPTMPIPIPQSPQRDMAPTHASSNSLASSTSGLYAAPSTSQPPQPLQPVWPPTFHASFSSLIYLTYRSHFKPIPPSQPPLPPPRAIDQPYALPITPPAPPVPMAPESPNRRWLAWVPGRSELTSDQGWGCMLRTGQMMLANAFIALYVPPLPPPPTYTNNYPIPSLPPAETDRKRFEAYVKTLVWFLDDPSPLAPFSVHRLALAGAEMGREVGHWFGPSIAAGSIKKLVNAFPSSGLGVVVPPDQIIHETAVFTASHTPTLPASASATSNSRDRDAKEKANRMKEEWGDRAVLILIGLRLGIDCVNPIYYDSVKALFTFPQTVGIAGGRPSSSYYFVGTQGQHLFYLDPHHTRPTVPLRMNDPSQPYDPTLQFSFAEMKTFHCDKVRKMHISGLDPSMLCGFVVRNLEEWRDLRARVDALAKANGKAPIFTIADAPAAWEMQDADDLSDVGMESISSDSMSVDHEFDEPEAEDRELPTPTVTQNSRMPADRARIVDDRDEDELDAGRGEPASADADADLDEEWEQTPGLKSPAATSSSNSTGERAETPVLVPFPLDPNPSPSGQRRASFGAASRERQRERETAKTLVPSSTGALSAQSASEAKSHSSRAGRVEKTDPLPALPPESQKEHREHRERVTAMSPPPSAKHHHHQHHHSHIQQQQQHKQSRAAELTPRPAPVPSAHSEPGRSKPQPAPAAVRADSGGRNKPQPRLPLPPVSSDLPHPHSHSHVQSQEATEEFSSPEELTGSMEFDTPVPARRGSRGSGASASAGGHTHGREAREERPVQRSRASSQWEKIEVS